MDRTRARIEIADDGPGPAVGDPPGMGFRIFDTLAARWGADVIDGRSTIWFELDAARVSHERAP